MTESEFRSVLEREIKRVGGLRRLAERLQVSASYLSDVRLGRRFPGPAILAPLGYVATRSIDIARRR